MPDCPLMDYQELKLLNLDLWAAIGQAES